VDDSGIVRRKDQHIDLAVSGDVGFHSTTTLLEQVRLVHDAMPDLALDELDTSTTVLGKTLRFPLVIAAMTGGSPRAHEINRKLAGIAQRRGYGFGLGSQRPMLVDPAATSSYQVRDVAPDVLLLGNIGLVQARSLSAARLRELMDEAGADALCVHMNPAQELVQPGGDTDFRGGAETFARLVQELGRPVVAKETGCGISPGTALRLHGAGVRHVDVSGAGGTSWVAIEALRARGAQAELGVLMREWGVPTAPSIAFARGAGLQTVIATGGIVTGLDIARALALGADAAGMARPVLQALETDGVEGAEGLLDGVERAVRAVMLLVGARDLRALAQCQRVVGPRLRAWLRMAARKPVRSNRRDR